MSEDPGDPQLGEGVSAGMTAGGLLRQARVAKGLHIAALATSIKVAPRKLELLEADRFDELPGATFTRALAQTVCRTLKLDPAPVLALLPQAVDPGLSQMSRGLNAPFRDKPGRHVPNDLQFLRSPVVLGAAVLALASLLLYVLPAGWVSEITQGRGGEHQTEGAPVASPPPVLFPPAGPASAALPSPPAAQASAAMQAASVPAGEAALPAAEPASTVAVPAPASLPLGATGVLLVRASAQSWVEVIDGRGNPLLSRLLAAGETVGLDGPSPLRVRIGNASATEVSFRGRPVELTPTRDNVAKLELR